MLAAVEQRRLLGCPDQPARKRASLNASMLIELAKLRYRLLNDAPPDAHAPHQPPVAVDLPVLPDRRVAQVHAPNRIPTRRFQEIPKVGTTSPNRLPATANPLIRLAALHGKSLKWTSNCASWANAYIDESPKEAEWEPSTNIALGPALTGAKPYLRRSFRCRGSNVGRQSGHEFCGGLASRRAPHSKKTWFPLR